MARSIDVDKLVTDRDVRNIHIPIGKLVKFTIPSDINGISGLGNGWAEGFVQGDYRWHILVTVKGEYDWFNVSINKVDIMTGAVKVRYKKEICA